MPAKEKSPAKASLQAASECLPWHKPLQRDLMLLHARAALHPALLFCAQRDTGKQRFAHSFAAQLVCQQPLRANETESSVACGQCRACELFRAGTHPDYHWVDVPESRQTIGINEVRALIDKLQLSAQLGGAKVAIITCCELLTESASNALLKALEEPSANTWFLLLAESRRSVLPTIASRSQCVHLPLPAEREVVAWLARYSDAPAAESAIRRARGFPERALAIVQGNFDPGRLDEFAEQLCSAAMTPQALAAKLERDELEPFLDSLSLRLLALQRRSALAGGSQAHNAGEPMLSAAALQELGAVVLELRRSLPRSPNLKLCLESLAYQFQRIWHSKLV
ncbi:MAG: DNA polymerase III subunit [Pseudomonadales bacterium]